MLVFVIVILLVDLDGGGGLVAHLHVQLPARGRDAQVPVAHLAHQVEGLAHGACQCQVPRVVLDGLLDDLAHLGCGQKEAVRRGLAAQRGVRTLEVVPLHVQLRAPEAVVEVHEDRARQKLLPQRLPPSLQLAHGHGMLRTALDVVDAVGTQLLLEFRLSTPRSVLPSTVRQDLLGAAVVAHGAPQTLHHERALLVVRQHVADDVATVVVQKRHHVHSLVLAQKEGEEVGHPQLICTGALEAPRGMAPGRSRRLPLDQTLLVQDPPHLALAHAQLAEACKHVADPPRPVLRMSLLLRDHRLSPGLCRLAALLRAAPLATLGYQRCRSALLVLAHPAPDCRGAHVVGIGHVGHGDAVLHHRLHYAHPHVQRIGTPGPPAVAASIS